MCNAQKNLTDLLLTVAVIAAGWSCCLTAVSSKDLNASDKDTKMPAQDPRVTGKDLHVFKSKIDRLPSIPSKFTGSRAGAIRVSSPSADDGGLSYLDQLRQTKMHFPPKYLDMLLANTTRVLKDKPDDADALLVRGFVQWTLHHFPAAKPDLEKARKLVKPDAELLRELGDCYLDEGLWDRALDCYGKALSIKPSDSDLHFKRAHAYLALHKYPEAIADANIVVAAAPNEGWVYSYRAEIYNACNKYQNVIDDLTQALKREPDSPRLFDLRARAFEKVGKKEAAKLDRQKVIDLTKDEIGF